MSHPVPEYSAIATALAEVRRRVDAAARAVGRMPDEVALVAVSKTFPAEAVLAAAGCGQRQFGENYVQEALHKIGRVGELAGLAGGAVRTDSLEWHFIGPIQGNKTRDIAENFSWAHGIEREKIARRLSEQRPPALPPLNVCIQVNVSGEDSKSGIAAGQAEALAAQISGLPGLKLRGLMCIPAAAGDPRPGFRQLRELLQRLNARGYGLDTLSMGMSGDFEAAIAEGATLVRVGSAIFGNRNYDK